jgi:hypothetical protein
MMMRSRLQKLVTNPHAWMIFHGVNVAKWVFLFVPGMWLWRDSVPFLMYVSLDTALAGALAGFGTALAARKADPEDPL